MSASFIDGHGRLRTWGLEDSQIFVQRRTKIGVCEAIITRPSPRFMRNRILSPAGTGARPVSGKEHFFDLAQVATF